MINNDQSSCIPSIHSFRSDVPLTSTPKRSTAARKPFVSQPLSSTFSLANHSSKQMDLSISAITLTKKCSLQHQKKRHRYRRHHRQRQTHIHSSTIIQRIELKDLLYSTRASKQRENKQRFYTDQEMKIYVI